MDFDKICVTRKGVDPKTIQLPREIENFLSIKIDKILVEKNFYIVDFAHKKELESIAQKLLTCPITEKFCINSNFYDNYQSLEITYQPGVMNPEAETIKEEMKRKNLEFGDVFISTTYHFPKTLHSQDLLRIRDSFLMNNQIEMELETPDQLTVKLDQGIAKLIPIRDMNHEQLLALSENTLFLTLEEMQTIQKYFVDHNRDPFDVELETLAQTWSEHCGHKTFKADVILDGKKCSSMWSMVKNSEKAINHQDVISKFADNSGVFYFAEDKTQKYGICIKAETHNSPSGLDPYGGAMTGSGGVFRDIAGTGKGAKNICSVDIFCLGDPDTKQENIFPGCLHPRRILKGVVEGVRDYGNRMGIPTHNGSLHFHPDFGPKPTVLVGADGIIPLKYAKKGIPELGDLIISFGGKTGKDGIHGATFSSAEMTDKTVMVNSGAVQIGNPIEEKRMFDCLLEIRDCDYIKAITDCGAGGYSSAIGEMGEKTGVKVDLSSIPLKYKGLSSYEKWISESQERMVAAVNKKHIPDINKICDKYNVEMTIVGEITNTKKLEIFDEGKKVCDLEMDFLHNGQPTETIIAKSYTKVKNKEPEYYEEEISYQEAFLDILSHLNVASKEPIIRQYDHGVQGTCVDGPLCGIENDGPTGGAILKPLVESDKVLIVGHGINPILNKIDPQKGAAWAFYESLSNVIALGGDPKRIFLVENYIWPKPTENNLSDLYKAVKSVTELSKKMKTPIISGKDSLSSTYKFKDKIIEVPPVVCISARSVADSVKETTSPDLKKIGSPILLLGDYQNATLGGSIFSQRLEALGNDVPFVVPETARKIYNLVHENIKNGNILSCSDVSEGGALIALAEMAIGGKKGVEIGVADKVKLLFAEVPAAFVVEVKNLEVADLLIESELAVQIGTTTSLPKIIVWDAKNSQNIIDITLDKVEDAWKKPFKKYF